ncbi:hypothetical protein ACLOJK_022770 [Asimina triloba]
MDRDVVAVLRSNTPRRLYRLAHPSSIDLPKSMDKDAADGLLLWPELDHWDGGPPLEIEGAASVIVLGRPLLLDRTGHDEDGCYEGSGLGQRRSDDI